MQKIVLLPLDSCIHIFNYWGHKVQYSIFFFYRVYYVWEYGAPSSQGIAPKLCPQNSVLLLSGWQFWVGWYTIELGYTIFKYLLLHSYFWDPWYDFMWDHITVNQAHYESLSGDTGQAWTGNRCKTKLTIIKNV